MGRGPLAPFQRVRSFDGLARPFPTSWNGARFRAPWSTASFLSPAPRALGYVAARRAARAVFAGDLHRESHIPVARVGDAVAVHATPDGAACALYGAGFSELLRLLVGFEGAMLHISCRATGGDVCEWRAAPPDPRHD